jgi:hypothetical protein
MRADPNLLKFQDSIGEIANLKGYAPSVFAITVAQMLAAIRGWPMGHSGVPGFLETDRELTRTDWQAIVGRLERAWPHTSEDNPFAQLGRGIDDPGILERLRRLVLSCLPSGEPRSSVPTWLLLEVVELARGKGRGMPSIDADVRQLLTEIIKPNAAMRVFCAYDGVIELAIQIATTGADVALDIQNREMVALCSCLAISAELRLHVRQGDPLTLATTDIAASDDSGGSYDVSVVAPPINQQSPVKEGMTLGTNLPNPSCSEAAGILLAVARSRGRALCLLPRSYLFQTTKAEQVFKERLIVQYGLDTVVGLHRGSLGAPAIFGALLICNETPPRGQLVSRGNDILMVDARNLPDDRRTPSGAPAWAELIASRQASEFSVLVTADNLLENDFNLSVERYVLDSETRRMRAVLASSTTVMLDDLVEFQRPQAIPSQKDTITSSIAFEVGVGDIDAAGLVRSAVKQVIITSAIAPQVRRARLEPGDIVLVVKGSVGKVGFVRAIPQGQTWLAGQSFIILRPRRGAMLSDPRILFRFLSSSLGQAAMLSLRAGTSVAGLQMADVRRLPIPVPATELQLEVAREVDGIFAIEDQITALRSTLVERMGQIWPESLVASLPERDDPAELSSTIVSTRRKRTS